MLLSFLSLISVILFNVLFYKNVITAEILIGLTELLLLFNVLRYLWFKWRKEDTTPRSKIFKIPTHPKELPLIRNKFLAQWHSRYSSRPVLPLNRIAFLKARYEIGPFKSLRYAEEISLSLLKSLATKAFHMQLENDECHPKCYATEYTELYIQYRALLYVEQGVPNVAAKSQCTFRSGESLDIVKSSETLFVLNSVESLFIELSESNYSSMPLRQYTSTSDPDATEDDNSTSVKSDIENLIESERWQEFEREAERTRQKLKEVMWRFKLMKEEQKSDDDDK